MKKLSTSIPSNLNGSVASLQSAVYDLSNVDAISVQVNYADDAPTTKTFVAPVAEVQTITLPAFAGFTDRDYVVLYDTTGVSYAVYGDKTGTSIAPTGAAYLAATYKVKANISADTTATQVCDRFRTAFNTLTGFTTAITTSGTSTLIATQVLKAPTTNPVPKNFDDSGAGAITVAETTAGVAATIDLVTNYITIASHPYVTGTKVRGTTTTTLPAGLALATDYFVVKIDANTIGLASSLILSAAGTLVDITNHGTGTHTLTTTASSGNIAKLQSSNDAVNYTDVSGKTVTISTSTSFAQWDIDRPPYKYLRVLYTPSAGQITLGTYIVQSINR
jgi:hypothetical protein